MNPSYFPFNVDSAREFVIISPEMSHPAAPTNQQPRCFDDFLYVVTLYSRKTGLNFYEHRPLGVRDTRERDKLHKNHV